MSKQLLFRHLPSDSSQQRSSPVVDQQKERTFSQTSDGHDTDLGSATVSDEQSEYSSDSASVTGSELDDNSEPEQGSEGNSEGDVEPEMEFECAGDQWWNDFISSREQMLQDVLQVLLTHLLLSKCISGVYKAFVVCTQAHGLLHLDHPCLIVHTLGCVGSLRSTATA